MCIRLFLRLAWQVSKSRDRRKLRAAYDYLMSGDNEKREFPSKYKDFVKRHERFLRRHPDPTDGQRRRPLQFLESEGLECALWPSLYWCNEMCETTERLTDGRRLAQAGDRVRLNDD